MRAKLLNILIESPSDDRLNALVGFTRPGLDYLFFQGLTERIEKGSGVPNKDKVGKVSKDKVREIATIKMPDINANDVEAGMKIVEGTARSMGIEVVA